MGTVVGTGARRARSVAAVASSRREGGAIALVAVRVRVTCPECAEAIEADASTDVPRSALVARIDVYNGAGTPVLDDATPRLQQHHNLV